MLAVTMPQGGLVWPFQWSSLMTDRTSSVDMDADFTSGSSVDNENTTLSQLLDAAFHEDVETTMAPLTDIGSTEKQISIPLFNEMEMNNDLLDLTKPFEVEGLQHGISSMSLDSLNNDHFVDAVEIQTDQDEPCLSEVSGLNSCPDTDIDSVIEEGKGSNQQLPEEKEINKQCDRNSENENSEKSKDTKNMQERQWPDSASVSAVSKSPESYTTLYKAFEIAQEEPIDINKPKESTLEMLNRTSPKLQRVALRKAKLSPEKKTFIGNNPVVIHQTTVTTLSKRSPLEDTSLNLTWKKFVKTANSDSVTTFADILQKKSTPSPKNENLTNLAVNDSVHWTELMQEKSDSESGNGVIRRVRKTNRISRPKSLPIQLRHIRRPAGRSIKTPEDKQSKAFDDLILFQTNLNALEEENHVKNGIRNPKSMRGYYEPTYMTNGYHTLPAVLDWYKNHNDIYTDQPCFKKTPVKRMADAPQEKWTTGKEQERDVGGCSTVDERKVPRIAAVDNVGNDELDDWQDLQALPPQDITVSPRPNKQARNVDMVVMKGLVTAVTSAVDLILTHFSRTSEMGPQDKTILGDTVRTPIIGLLVLDHLCPAIANILKDGMKPYIRNYIIGRTKNSIWQVVEATTELGPGTRSLYELVCLIQEQKSLTTDYLKFNAFIFGLLSTKCLEIWLNHIRRHRDIVQTYYEKNAFLSQCTTTTTQLFNDLLVAVQPLSLLPFKLALDFEIKYTQKQTYRTRKESFTTDPQPLMSLPWLGKSTASTVRQRTSTEKDEQQQASWQNWASPSNILGSLRSHRVQSKKAGVESTKIAVEPQKTDAYWMRSKELLKSAIIGRDNASMKTRSDKSHSNAWTQWMTQSKPEEVKPKYETFQNQRKSVKHDSMKNERNQISEGVTSQTGSSRSWSLGWMTGAVSKKLYGKESPKQDVRYPVIDADKEKFEELLRTNQSEVFSESVYPSTSVMDNIGTNVIKAFDYMLLPKQTPKEYQMVEMRRTRPQKTEDETIPSSEATRVQVTSEESRKSPSKEWKIPSDGRRQQTSPRLTAEATRRQMASISKELKMKTSTSSEKRKTSPSSEKRKTSPSSEKRKTSPSSDGRRKRTSPSSSRKLQNLVKTRCHNVSMEEGFLSFSKGEVLQLKEYIDRELLLCTRGEESGLVYEAHVEKNKPIDM